jgi:hypothetical protein
VALDNPTPLATVAQFTEGPFANLVSGYSTQAQNDLMLQATRACEDACDRRLTPFVNIVETQRADAMDIEDAMDAYVPLDPTSQLGFSRAQSLGSTLLTRHFWVREFPPRYPELWTGNISAINLFRSYSGVQAVAVSGIQYEPDTGHCRFQLGTFVPPGTTIQVTYSGGYATVPASLVQACQYMAASMAVKQLDPVDGRSGHDPDALRSDALEMLAPFTRK